MSAAIVAPTDAQLTFIASLCRLHGVPLPTAIYSKADASDCIEAIKRGQYDPDFYAPGAPTFYGADSDPDIPF